MDPNALLEEIRELFLRIIHEEGSSSLAEPLASRVAALDEWLSRGGFLPSAWDGQSTGQYAESTERNV